MSALPGVESYAQPAVSACFETSVDGIETMSRPDASANTVLESRGVHSTSVSNSELRLISAQRQPD
jgi:hypothetical protein